MMKRLILVTIFLFGGFVSQAKWVELPQADTIKNISATGNHLWAISVAEKKYFLIKFDYAKNNWSKVASLPGRPKAFVALTDGTVLVFYIGKYTKETQARNQELYEKAALSQKKIFQDLIFQGKLSKDLLAVRDAFEKDDPVNGWRKFLSSEEFRKADRDALSAVLSAGSQILNKIMSLQNVYDSTFTKFRSDGQSTVYNFKLSGSWQSVVGSPDGTIFLLSDTEETNESRAAFEAAMKPAFQSAKKSVEELIKKGLVVEGEKIPAIAELLQKLVQEGKIDKKVVDLWSAAWSSYSPAKEPGTMNPPEWIEFFEELERAKLDKKLKFSLEVAIYNTTIALDEIYNNMERQAEKKKKYTQPLYRFFNGKLERIADLGNKEYDFVRMDAVNKNELWLSRRKEVGKDEVNNRVYDYFVQKWDGTSFQRIGGKIPNVGFVSVGSDKSVYVAGSPIVDNEYVSYLLTLVNGSWQPQNIAFDKQTKEILNFSVITENNVWFLVKDRDWNNFLYRWNGKTLKKIKGLAIDRLLQAKYGSVLIETEDGKIYRWAE